MHSGRGDVNYFYYEEQHHVCAVHSHASSCSNNAEVTSPAKFAAWAPLTRG